MAENTYVKFGPNQHIGSLELNRYKKAMEDKYNTLVKYMILEPGLASAGTNLQVVVGTSGFKYTLKAGIAIDADLNVIHVPFDVVDVFDLAAAEPGGVNGTFYLYIEYKAPTNLNEEEGTVSIDSLGNLTGIGTKFTECLRGQPYHPMRIKFTNSTYNFQEYDINVLTSDTAASIKLVGGITPESNLKYKVVGSFTPGVSVPKESKDIYKFDGQNWQVGYIKTNVNFDPSLLARPKYQFGLAGLAFNLSVDVREQFLTLI
jgi:hypothetical protein